MNVLENLIDIYARDVEIANCKLDMMGKMLDTNYLKKRIGCLKVSELFIYGGGYLGIQFYRNICNAVNVLSVIDKSGRLVLDLDDIPVINISQLKKMYNGQKVIITPIMYYQEIKKELVSFIPEESILFLGEFLGGVI